MAAFLKKPWWIFCGVLGVLLLWLGVSYGVYQANKTAFDNFNRAAIAGKIKVLETQNHGASVAIQLNNNQRYRFFPAKQQGGTAGFMTKAVVGDSIWKESLSDTLVLVKQGKVVRYTFKRVLY